MPEALTYGPDGNLYVADRGTNAVYRFDKTTGTLLVTFGGATANVVFSGLVPGLVGLFQINAVVPAGSPSGNVDLVVTVGTSVSKTAKIVVQ